MPTAALNHLRVAYDLIGPGPDTLLLIHGHPAFAADLAALLDHLEITDVVIGGLSMGGQIAMEFCRQYPGRVRGLLLAATFPQPESETGKLARNTMADRLLREGMKPYAAEVLDQMPPAGLAARLAGGSRAHAESRGPGTVQSSTSGTPPAHLAVMAMGPKYASVCTCAQSAIRPGRSPCLRSFTTRHGWVAPFR